MSFNFLELCNVRNIEHFSSAIDGDCFIIFGGNGSGKTSFVEAVYLLCRGKSFKSKNLDTIVSYNKREFTCYGEFIQQAGGIKKKIGISRNKGNKSTAVKQDGVLLHNVSQIVAEFPVLLINPGTFKLLEGGPAERRKFLDWGVFHVEHSYKVIWRNWRTSLAQRNKLLKSDRIMPDELSAWTQQFADLSLSLVKFRKDYYELLAKKLTQILRENTLEQSENAMLGEILGKVSITFFQGWPDKENLGDLLTQQLEADRKRGFTGYGPHKGDIQFKYYNVPVLESLSRGQVKLFISYLLLAQLRVLKELNQKQCTVLIDDIGAELDIRHQIDFLSNTLEEDAQVFVTVLDSMHANTLYEKMKDSYKTQMFHVEHGKFEAH